MASIVDKSSGRTIYKAPRNLDFPQVDVLTLLFDHRGCSAQEETIVHASASDPSQSLTKAQLRPLVTSTAHVLRHRYGIGSSGPGKDVCLCIATGHYQMPTLYYATIAADGIFSASNPGSTPKELAVQLAQVSAKLIFCTEETKATALAAAELVNLSPDRVLLFSSPPGPTSSLSLSTASTLKPVPIDPNTHHHWTRITSPSVLSTLPICILFSSGTTGPPKGCKLTHTNIVSEAALVLDPLLQYYRNHPSATKRNLATVPNSFRTIAHLPAAHIAGIQGYFINQFYLGGTVYWMPRFDFPQFLKYSRQFKMTQFFTVPPVFLLIAKSEAVTDHFDHVDFAISGAAPMGKDLQTAARKKLGKGQASLSQTWGLSETTGSITSIDRHWIDANGGDDTTGSVSMLISKAEARIVDESGHDVTPGDRGEIWVRGPNVVTGYWENQEADRQAFCVDEKGDKWFMTGDVALWNPENGLFYIVDRKKELIKYKGMQVAPAELEALLITHPGILDAAVIGVEGEGTEVPRAYVVPVDRKGITENEIVEWVSEQVSNYKRIRGGVVFLDAIPKSPSGKILRKDLRELAKRQSGVASKL
ncbi:putative 4-coumarate--CoA ligase [Naviculisporaceae sp. PSN 640]